MITIKKINQLKPGHYISWWKFDKTAHWNPVHGLISSIEIATDEESIKSGLKTYLIKFTEREPLYGYNSNLFKVNN